MSGLRAAVTVRHGSFELVAELEVPRGQVLGLLGPNGAGKTTLLRTLTGALPLLRGHVRVDDRVLADAATGIHIPMHRRRVGLMHQDYLLFEHLTVLENVAFGPRAQGVARRVARDRAAAWLQRLGIEGTAGRRPGVLSGGQRQRVALARALAAEPDLLLLDEPLAALDASARAEIRHDLRRHLTASAVPSVVVTHDPVEAMLLTDRILVLEGGRATHAGTPSDVAEHPRTAYVAGLLGINLLAGRARDGHITLTGGGELVSSDQHTDGPVTVLVSPTAVSLHLARPPEGSPRNVWPATVAGVETSGERVRLRCQGRPSLLVDITPAALADLRLDAGAPVWLSVKASSVRLDAAAPDQAAEPSAPV